MTLARAGQYLYQYERRRYSFRERYAWLFDLLVRRTTIIVPQDPEHFADISFYQAGMDWDVYALYARAAIIRVGQNTWPDTSFVKFYEQAKELGIALGGYWFFDGRASPDQQLEVIKNQMKGRSFELELFVDWERNYGGAYEGLPRVTELMQKIETAGIKCKTVGMYTGYYWFLENSSAAVNAAQYTYLKERPLWLAWYSSQSAVRIPPPWTNWTHWQYGTPSLKWGQPTVEIDANYFNGSKNQFEQKYLAGTIPPANGGDNMNGQASEILGKTGTIRTSPEVVSGNDTGKRTQPFSVVEFLEVVNGKNVPADKWFKLPDGNFLNYIVSGRVYFKITRDPVVQSEPPAEDAADMPYTITLGGGGSPYVETVVTGVVKAK